MSGHYCSEHGETFFKTPNMRGYAHTIKDAKGKVINGPNGKALWCNEEEAAEPSAAPQEQHEAVPEKPFEPAINQQKQASIEGQNARTNLTNLAVAGRLDEGLELALISQLCSFAGLLFDGSHKEKGGHMVEAAKQQGAIEVDRTKGQFPNQGAFLNKCWSELGFQRPDVEKLLGGPITAKTDFDGAWLAIQKSVKK